MDSFLGSCSELSAFSCVVFSEQLSLPAHTSGLPVSSHESWTRSPVLEPAAWLCERVQQQPLNPINSFLGRPRRVRQIQLGSGWVAEWKSFEEKEISNFGSRSRNTYFRKRSDIIKSTPLSLCGTDSHFPDVLCQVFHK